MKTNGMLILSTPRALDLGHRVACSAGATRVVDPLEYGRKAAERLVGDDYLAVVQQVVQARSSGIKGREGLEYLILVHPGICDLPKDAFSKLKARLDGILKNKAPQWVVDRQVWRGASEALVLELTVLSDASNELSSLLPSVDVNDMQAKPIADVVPTPSPSPEPTASVPHRPVSWKVWLIVIAALMGIAVAFIVSSGNRGGVEPGDPPPEPLTNPIKLETFDFLPEAIRPRTDAERDAVSRDIQAAIESLATIIQEVPRQGNPYGLPGWHNQHKDASLPPSSQLAEQWACIISFLRALEDQTLAQSDNKLDLSSLNELDLSFIDKIDRKHQLTEQFKHVEEYVNSVVDLANSIVIGRRVME